MEKKTWRIGRTESKKLKTVPGHRRLRLPHDDRLGPAAFRHARGRDQRRARDHGPRRDQPDDPDPARQLVLRGLGERGDLRHAGPARQPGRPEPPVEQDDDPEAAEARLHGQVQLGRLAAHLRQAHRHARLLRHRRRPVRPPVGDREGRPRRPRLPQGDRATASRWCCRRRRACPRWSSSGRCRSGRTRSSATAPAPTTRPTRRSSASTASRRRSAEVRAGRTKSWSDFKVPEEAVSVGFHEAARGVLSHHMVIRDGKIANYQPYPPTPWNASSRDVYGTPGPYEDAVQNTPIFEENGPGELQGHRHHARGAELRPVPAVRRAHVPRRRAASRRWCTHRRAWHDGRVATRRRAGSRPSPVERVQELTAPPGGDRGRRGARDGARSCVGRDARAVRRGPGADRSGPPRPGRTRGRPRRRSSTTASSAACC